MKIIDRLTTVLLVLAILMSIAAIGVKVFASSADAGGSMLSLGQAPSPSGGPLFAVDGSANARYFRGAIGISYDGKHWLLEKTKGDTDLITCVAGVDRFPLKPTEMSLPYSAYEREVLESAATLSDTQYLELPETISDRIRELSLSITSDFDTPFEKAKAIETFLRINCSYEIDFTPAPSDWEPNDWFLFESKEGICGNFASAFVILARSSGIPSRLAAGYFVASSDTTQLVYEDQAHAWGEVGFEGIGWVAFDAT